MIALDSSVLIAHLNPYDAHHTAATEILLNANPGAILVHSLTLAEVLVGGVRTGRGHAVRDDLRMAGVQVAPPDVDEALRLAELRVTTRLKLPDCCVLDIALRHGASLATFDHALAAAARRRGVAVIS